MSEVDSIFHVWGTKSGYVFLPRKLRDGSAPFGPKNHAGKWEEKGSMFQWPDQKADIVSWIRDSHKNKYDLYWCPCVFAKGRRVKENIDTMDVLYADLDDKDPNTLPTNLRPNMAWESSPGRYAAVWKLDTDMSASEAEILNKRLTYFIGADKGGWDLTQVLRVPGLKNYKYEGAPKGKLLWFEKELIPPYRFKTLPQVDMSDLKEMEPDPDFELESEPSMLPDIVRPYIGKISTKTLQLLFASENDVLMEDRSAKLWELECKLLEEGVAKNDVIRLVAASAWNKYKGRRDETRRLITEVEKAAEQVGENTQQLGTVERKWTAYSDLLSKKMEDPGWMIEGIWQKTSHGMIAGEPKTYKSVIVTDMAVSVASGKPFLGKFPVNHQGPVLYVQEENASWLVQDRTNKIANSRGLFDGKTKQLNSTRFSVQMPQDIPLYYLNNTGINLTLKEDREFLEQSVADIRPVLIIFDSLYLMLGDKDENSSKDMRTVLTWLLNLRYNYRTSVIVLHHWNKSGKSERGGQRMLGTVLLHAWVESAIYTSVINEQEHEIAIDREFRSFPKPNKLDVKFRMGDPGDDYYDPQIGDIMPEEGDAVYDLIAMGGAVSESEIKDTLQGIKKKDLQERLKNLLEQGKIDRDSNGNYRAIRKQKEETNNGEETES